MNKFKAGDRVRCITANGAYGQFTYGNRYTVKRAVGTMVYVERDDFGSTTNGWRYDNFELVPQEISVPSARKTWIIITVLDGKLAPAPTPAEYKTAEQARAVARSMAEKVPGQTFVVFEATGAAYVAPAPKADFVTL